MTFGGLQTVLRETGVEQRTSRDIAEQDWPDGELNPDSCGRCGAPAQETPQNRDFIRIHGTSTSCRHRLTHHHSMGMPTSMEQLDVRQPTVELETTPFLPVLEPVSKPTQPSETTEPRAKQPRIGERVYPSRLRMPIPSTPLSQQHR